MTRLSIILLSAMALTASCSSKKQETVATEHLQLARPVIGGTTPADLPMARAYRMSGDATADNVPVQVDSKGNIVSYPAPTDLIGQEPVALADGYLLDRRGISAYTRFTRYTYAEYIALKTPPTPSQLKAAIIPGARPVDIVQLPLTAADAAANPDVARAALQQLFSGE